MSAGFVISLIAVAVAAWAIMNYNRLVKLQVRAKASWQDIDVQLKRRYDLIPNLVETVKGYASHEKKVFEQVTIARTQAINASSPKEQALAEEGLKNTLKSLFAVVENYPDLKANANFLELQRSFEQVEDTVQRSRVYYNAVVRDFNTRIRIFPQSVIANMFHFQKREFYMLPNEEQREAPRARF